jgi:hypothetical protein
MPKDELDLRKLKNCRKFGTLSLGLLGDRGKISMSIRCSVVCVMMNSVLQVREVSFHALRAIGRTQYGNEWNAMSLVS